MRSCAIALTLALGVSATAWSAAVWTGSSTGDITAKGNYQTNNNTWSIYCNSDNLTGNKRTSLWIKKDVAQFKLGDSSQVYKGLFFQKGTAWEFHTNLDQTEPIKIFTFDNLGGSDSSNDKDRICIGCNNLGNNTVGDAALKMYDIKVKTRCVLVGSSSSSSPTRGTLVLTNYTGGAHAPVELTLTGDFQIYNGRVESTAATVISSDGIVNIGYSDNASAELVINSGTWKTARLWMSRNNNNVAKLYVRGGLLQTTGIGDNGRIIVGATDGVSTNYVEISGGTVDCSSGTCLALGHGGVAASRSELLVNGGTLRCRDLFVGNQSSAKATVTSGLIDVSSGCAYFAYNANCTTDRSCELNLDGGTLATKQVRYRAGTAPATLNFNGGVLKACADGTLVQAHDRLAAVVGAGGAAIDTDHKSVVVEEPLLAADSVAGDLSVTGGGVAAFPNLGGISGAFTVGADTSLRWFDQDGAVSAYSVGELNLAPGAALFLDADATGCDQIAAGATHVTATPENPAVVVLVSGAALADSVTYSILDASDASVFNVLVLAGGAVVPCAKSIVGGCLVVTADPSAPQTDELPSGVWTGWAGTCSMNDPLNWRNGRLPVASDTLDFSAVAVDTTIAANIPSAPAYAGIAVGGGVVTFNGDITFGAIDDSSKVAVGVNSTVTLDGDLLIGGSGDKCVVHRVDDGGAFVVTGKLGKEAGSTCTLAPQSSKLGEETIGRGAIVAGELVNDGDSGWLYACVNKTRQRWVVGPGGIGGTAPETGVWVLSDASCEPVFQPNTNDFAVSLRMCLREDIGGFTFDTTGWGDGKGHTVRLDAGFSDSGDQLFIKGSGRVVCSHAPIAGGFGGYSAYGGCVDVRDTATLALDAGCRLTSGPTLVGGGSKLLVAQSGTADAGKVVMDEGSTLAFNFTERGTAPKLRLSKGLRGTVPVRICSYNMRCLTDNDTGDKSWNSRKAAFVAFVKEMDPDVIGFQEGRVAQNEYLKSNLESSGWTYLAGTPAFKSGSVGMGYLPIAFKTSRFTKSGEGTFWLSNSPATESSVNGAGEKRICHWVKLRNTTTGDDFVFACTHLDLNKVRNAQMQVILNNSGGLKSYIDDGTPLVLVGDMNCLETENTIFNAKKKLNDAFLVSQTTPTGPWRSFNGFTYREPASEITSAALLEKGVETRNGKTYSGNSRIDFVLVSKDIVVKSFACRSDTQGDVMGNGVNQYPSDHFPQLVELMMPTKGAAGGRFSVTVARSCPSIVRDARFVLTEGAGLDSADKIDFRLPHWVEGASVENGEIVISTQRSTDGLVITIR